MILPFGKYKGQEIEATPTAYLKWFEENVEASVQLREAINAELKIRTSEETSVGRSTESPTYTSLEEMLASHLVTWLKAEKASGRLSYTLDREEAIQVSLYTCLKREVPRIVKLWRAQTK